MRLTLRLLAVSVLSIGLWTTGAQAGSLAPVQFVVQLSGASEVPSGSGDPDGSGVATLLLDGSNNSISWNITVSNIQTPIFLDHIHQGAAGTNGPVVIDFSASLVGGPIIDPDVANVLANPTGYYVNVHTTEFQAGAIRGQIPEPTTALLLALGLASLALGRRTRAA